jgi:hypothetical protein
MAGRGLRQLAIKGKLKAKPHTEKAGEHGKKSSEKSSQLGTNLIVSNAKDAKDAKEIRRDWVNG